MRVVAQNLTHHPLQIILIFENEGTCICQSLPDTILRIVLSCFVVGFTDGNDIVQMEMIKCLKLCRKSIKTHMAS